MENEGQAIRKKWISVRVSDEEHAAILEKFKRTTFRRLSHYARQVLLQKPVTVKFRDASLDGFVEELILLRSALHSIAVNFNQVVRKLNSLKEVDALLPWMEIADRYQSELNSKVEIIQKLINEASRKWLQS